MEFNLDVPLNQFFIRSISEKGIRVDENYFVNPFIISGQRIIPDWNVSSMSDITNESLKEVFDLEPEVVLIGTGDTQKFLSPALQAQFFQRSIGLEVMTTSAACRTYNVLASEGRQVVAAILPLSP